MAFKDYFFTKEEPKQEIKVSYTPLVSTFSTPFGKIGDGNLALPYVNSITSSEPWIRFNNNGTTDNLYPQMITQLFYVSPLNGSILEFKKNAVIGGGYTLESTIKTGKAKVTEYEFLKNNHFDDLADELTLDLIMHHRIYVKMCKLSNGKIRYERIGPEKVRTNREKSIFTICDDWSRSVGIYTLPAYTPEFKGEVLYSYELFTPGQDHYPIPKYVSSFNACMLQGEIPYLQKSNIINSIFPSFMLTIAKKFESVEEANSFRDTVNKGKGAPEAGRIMTFAAEFKEELPTITPIPANTSDTNFIETDTIVQNVICQAHSIDPLIMGIRVSSKLGSGTELPMAYSIFEKNVVMPLRKKMELILNDLLFIGGVQANLKINIYQIVDNEIINKTNTFK